MGRAPCCDKANVKKGPWSPEEDAKLKSYIQQHGTGGNWIALPPKIGLKRCGKSCRLRWLNYLRPNLKHGDFSQEEDNIICSLYVSIGSRWSVIAAQLPGRTDNDIKNYWNTRLKKKLLGNNKNRRNKEQQQLQACSNNNGINKQQETSSINGGSVIIGDDSLSSLLVHENSSTTHQQQQQQQQCYWPHFMPVLPIPNLPYSTTNNNQQFYLGSSFNDQDSIKKLLIKLGGRFHNDVDYHNYHPTLGDGLLNHLHQSQGTTTYYSNNSTQQQVLYHQEQIQFDDGNNGLHHDEMVQRKGNLNNEIEEEMVGNTNFIPQRLLNNGLGFFHGDMVFSEDKIIIGSTTTRPNWGENSSGNSVIYHPLISSSNYQEDQGVRPSEECALQEYSTIATMRTNSSNSMLHVQ
ncbi:hypothetical protein HN51_017479 [Arachis hypogaea]|uniref:Transcription factor n=1 Tax=Arachis hypogaea TaxID=3818 RepID=A0A445CXE6_ARAHY|nr:transcription factor MYB36 [Arachis hypogaea]QHN88657.1 Transcription factor [Arachis hypogaea]RYR55599.1 hypothetical protein Ahy_A06g030783 [Arachis hypogaea]